MSEEQEKTSHHRVLKNRGNRWSVTFFDQPQLNMDWIKSLYNDIQARSQNFFVGAKFKHNIFHQLPTIYRKI